MIYSVFEILSYFFGGMLLGSGLFYIYQVFFRRQRERALEKETNRILNKAKSEAYRIEKKTEIKVKDWKIKMQNEAKKQILEEKNKLQSERDKLQFKQTQLLEEYNRKKEDLNSHLEKTKRQQVEIQEKKSHLELLQQQRQEQIQQLSRQLENIAQMNAEEAKKELKQTLEEEVKTSLAPQLRKIENDLKENSQKKCRDILAAVIARHAGAVTTESTIDRLPVSGDEVKGKIIGREGRNIRALEHSCGVDILIEEGQDSISISCFDSVRREVAKKAITQLIKDGRVHPSRIEGIVEKVKNEIFQFIKEEGEKACFELNVHDVHPEMIKVLGGLTFKTLDGQNALQSSMDLAYLSGHIMVEIGGDEKLARRAALFHSIGLNLDHKVEGHYAQAGADFAQKHREKPEVVHAILCHNSHVEAQSVLDHVLQTAFNLYQSLSSPKRTNIENFISRMKKVESIANSFSGVIRSFAIRAGKELRVLVDSSQVTDDQTNVLCLDIARKIERELSHTYQIKVSVIRESRIIEHAR